jgi:CDP-diacylglycerol--glycerol-3-phosphate 3-phosphatidyltransferase
VSALGVPNALTLARMAAALPVAALIGSPHPAAPAWALATFALAMASDVVDGALARRWGRVTPLGAFLDPLADKVLVLSTLIALSARGLVPAGVVAVLLAREAAVTGLRAAAAGKGASLGASAYGKAKTVLQALACGGLLLALAAPSQALAALAYALLWGAVGFTILTGAGYLLAAPRAGGTLRTRAP